MKTLLSALSVLAWSGAAFVGPSAAQSGPPAGSAEIVMGAKPVSPAPGAGLCYEAINRGKILRQEADGTLVIVLEYNVFWITITAANMRCSMARFTE